MSRVLVRHGCAALLFACASAAQVQAQTPSLSGDPLPAVSVPDATTAAAEEPAGMYVNPAAPGFVRRFSTQYFHEHSDTSAFRADALFLALPLGDFVPVLAMDWIHPDQRSRFRRTTLGAALGGDDLSIGYSFTWFQSPNADVERLTSWQAGLTVRPVRFLSIGASALDRGMRLGRTDLPARYRLGAGVRLWDDRVTLSSDVLVSDRTRNAFDAYGLAVGAGVELWRGVVLNALFQAPFRGPSDAATGIVAVTWNERHLGLTGAWSDRGSGSPQSGLFGLRASAEAYRAALGDPERSVRVDLARELERGGFLIFPGRSDPYGRLLGKLRDLRDDPSVRDVQLVVRDLPVGGARTQELRAAVAELAARKPVIAYLRAGRLREYWLASAATTVVAPPSGVVDLSGLASTTPFLRDGLARIGVAFEVVAAGRYKSAPDPLVRSDMSDAQREVTVDVLDRISTAIVDDIAAARRMPVETVRAWIDQALFTAADAKAAGVLDEVGWPDELGEAGGYSRPEPRRAQRWGPRPTIAIVPVEGAILQGKSRRIPLYGAVVGDETTAREIRRAVDDDVDAIVLRIDSPGGDAIASDLIWREVMLARHKGKPVIASMGDVAASGGYLVACGADAIVAEPTTLTGSIGVFVVKPDFSGLLEKLGIHTVTIQRGRNATLRSTTKPWTPTERAAVERSIQGFYDVFLSRVAEGRHLDKEQVEAVAGGRVWTGAEAVERGLVDRVGSISDAVALARELARIGAGEDVTIRRYEPDRGLALPWSGAAAPDALQSLARYVPEAAAAALLLEIGAPVALPTDWVSGGGVGEPSR